MGAMVENRMHTLPPHRHAALQQQLEFLARTVEGKYTFAEDRMLARTADLQGGEEAVGRQAVPDVSTG